VLIKGNPTNEHSENILRPAHLDKTNDQVLYPAEFTIVRNTNKQNVEIF